MSKYDYTVFKGIKYATSKRFKKSKIKPFKKFNNVEIGYIAPQPHNPIEKIFSISDVSYKQSEDCLYLNIWRSTSSNKKKPVMIWIHGGGFINGHGNLDINSPEIFVQNHDCIVVTINYRLGAFGFLDLSDFGDFDINVGLSDQINAIRWVTKYIQLFDGDPNNITLAGQSAGAISIHALLMMPEVEKLVHKSILISGTFQMTKREDVQKISKAFIEKYNEIYKEVPFNELSTNQILKISREISSISTGSKSLELLYQPLYDPLQMSKTNINIPTLIGTTQEEGNLYIPSDKHKFDESIFTSLMKHANIYTKNLEYDTFQKQADIITKHYFRKPAHNLAKHIENCWVYEFRWSDKKHSIFNHTIHILDIPFVFGNLKILKKKGAQIEKDDFNLSVKMMEDFYKIMKFGYTDWEIYKKNKYVKIYK